MKAVSKDYWREIKNSRSRFISILVLVSLAVSFLSGLRSTAPDMKSTGHNYFESLNLADIQILSTLGITDEDVEVIIDRPEIEDAEGVYVIDAFAVSDTTDRVAKVHSLPEKNISNVILMKGRMPEKNNECLVEAGALSGLSVSIGDKIHLDTASNEGALKSEDFVIVGVVRSPIYIALERGSATIGTGSVSMYMYVPKDAFSMDCYTAVFARAAGAEGLTAFSDEYNDYIDGLVDSMRDFSVERANKRYDDIIDDANTQIGDAQELLDDAKKQLSDAEKKLSDARKELDDGWKEYNDGVAKLEDGKKQFEEGKKKLEDGKKEYEDGLKELEDAKKEIEDGEKELNDSKKLLDDGEAEYKSGLRDYESGVAQYNAGLSQISSGRAQLAAQESQLNQAIGFIDTLISSGTPEAYVGIIATNPTAFSHSPLADQVDFGTLSAAYDAYLNQASLRAQIADGYAQIAAGEAQVASYASQISGGRAQLDAARKELDDGWKQYNDGVKALEDGKKELADGQKKLDDAKKEIEDGEKELADNEKTIKDGEKELADAKKKLDDGEREYSKGYKEYIDKKKDADELIEDGQKEIDDAKSSLEKMEGCDWYIFDRSYNPGYDGLGQDADRMGNLAKVFPIIFFLVAALVCLTNMTRMVEEQRIQIGGMKALGYSKLTISMKYVGYGLIPSALGCIIGLCVGFTVFPTMIFTAYQIMYQVPNIELHWYNDIAVMCFVSSIACTTLSSLWACLATLRETPANLMRPKTPPAGKRVFLEYITFIWNKMKFIHKVTARNLFRYQKRFWMTVIGIAGCTALMIAGFGIRSSLTFTMGRQYDELFHYDAQVTISTDISEDELNSFKNFVETEERITGYTHSQMMSYTARTDEGNQTAYLFVLDNEEVKDFIDILDYDTGEMITMGDDGIYLDKKLSELLNVSVGDTILIDSDDKVFVEVAGIFEHYTGHFTYMTPTCYENTFGKEYNPNGYLMKFSSIDPEFCDEIFEDFMEYDGILSTSRMYDVKDTYLRSMERIDFVVIIIILCSGALALIVLYNLSDINISERRRELATIKVLGFYDNEVSAYVYRENVVLTIFGIILGLLLGHALHTWLVRSVEIDLMMFGRETSTSAYIFSAILTVVFAIAANYIAHLKMKKIDMVESLKSAE